MKLVDEIRHDRRAFFEQRSNLHELAQAWISAARMGNKQLARLLRRPPESVRSQLSRIEGDASRCPSGAAPQSRRLGRLIPTNKETAEPDRRLLRLLENPKYRGPYLLIPQEISPTDRADARFLHDELFRCLIHLFQELPSFHLEVHEWSLIRDNVDRLDLGSQAYAIRLLNWSEHIGLQRDFVSNQSVLAGPPREVLTDPTAPVHRIEDVAVKRAVALTDVEQHVLEHAHAADSVVRCNNYCFLTSWLRAFRLPAALEAFRDGLERALLSDAEPQERRASLFAFQGMTRIVQIANDGQHAGTSFVSDTATVRRQLRSTKDLLYDFEKGVLKPNQHNHLIEDFDQAFASLG